MRSRGVGEGRALDMLCNLRERPRGEDAFKRQVTSG
jgi:hypothetical protein